MVATVSTDIRPLAVFKTTGSAGEVPQLGGTSREPRRSRPLPVSISKREGPPEKGGAGEIVGKANESDKTSRWSSWARSTAWEGEQRVRDDSDNPFERRRTARARRNPQRSRVEPSRKTSQG